MRKVLALQPQVNDHPHSGWLYYAAKGREMHSPRSKLRGITPASLRYADSREKIKSCIHPPCKQRGIHI
jgi:hypothetical protein